MKQNHPDEPHWYLAVLGSDPTYRGQGFGNALLASRLEQVDAEHAPAYLNPVTPTTSPITNGSASRSPANWRSRRAHHVADVAAAALIP